MAGAGALITTAGYLGFKLLTGKAAAVDEASGGTTTASEA